MRFGARGGAGGRWRAFHGGKTRGKWGPARFRRDARVAGAGTRGLDDSTARARRPTSLDRMEPASCLVCVRPQKQGRWVSMEDAHLAFARWKSGEVATGERAETRRCSKTRGVASREAPGVVTRGHETPHEFRTFSYPQRRRDETYFPYGVQCEFRAVRSRRRRNFPREIFLEREIFTFLES